MDEELKLVKPNESFKNEYFDMMEEWKKSTEKIIPLNLNLGMTNFDLMLEKLDGYSKGIGLEEGFVEYTTYWLVNKNNRILGAVNVRHVLNEILLFRGGHIGYGIRPSERKKGYATKMLFLTLDVCRTMGILRVLITCSKNNIGSAKTIINNGGILDSEGTDKGDVFQRYWIDLM